MSEPLLDVDISIEYPGRSGAVVRAAFAVGEAEAFGLAGPSGAGKSSIALAILRLLDRRGGRSRGRLRFAGRDLMQCSERELRLLRGKDISLVMQSPAAALNPALRLENQLREAWQIHEKRPWREARGYVQRLLSRMGLDADDDFLRRYPRQVSVGQAQRIVIAMAIMHQPRLLIADEPTSALDPASRRSILEILAFLNQRDNMAILYISHDLASMQELCTRSLELGACQLTA